MTLKYGPNLGQLIAAAAGDEHYQAILAQWRALDALVQPSVISRVSALPNSGMVEGDRYLFVGSGTNANRIARYREANTESASAAGWDYYTPKDGWVVWSSADTLSYRYKAGAWTVETGGSSGSGLSVGSPVSKVTADRTLSLGDAGATLVVDSSNAVVISIPAQAGVGFADSTEVSVIQLGTGAVSIAPASGVAVLKPAGFNAKIAKQCGAVTLKRIAADNWILLGFLEASS